MLERVVQFGAHCALDLLFYRLPRCLVTLPLRLFAILRAKIFGGAKPRDERHIDVIASQFNSIAGRRTMSRFGVTTTMRYHGPLYSGHMHTVLGGARLSRRVTYERELLTADDTNPICLDWLKVPASSTAKGVLLLIPGLGNYGQSNYIQRFARCAVQRGYHVCLLTPRGMGSAPLTTPNITCVTFTADIRHTLRTRLQRGTIEREFGVPLPLFAVGHSCGGSTLIKCVAEETQAQLRSNGEVYRGGFPIDAVVSMIAPVDMKASADMLRTRMGKLLYAKPIFVALCKYLRKHRRTLQSALEGKTAEEAAKLPLIHRDFEAAMERIHQPVDIDEHVVAAHFGYPDRFTYYKDGDALQYVERIHGIPVLCLNTRDDPIVGYAVTQAAWQAACNVNPNAVYVEVPTGGHFGFVQSPLREWANPFSFLQTFPLDALDHVVASQQGKKKQ